ncbi:hypothetical protein SKAU_G00222140 [Synaphobranchus kaupii]|uniref:Uncharacterized protein n=1 Tax=Synaphobranchus kaupii TaxID=118154 RepID=A0A9Q1IV37_SYNKA|nr:hypothetical protein SKAU_G00222140 [Synaphobranchus kaupii]
MVSALILVKPEQDKKPVFSLCVSGGILLSTEPAGGRRDTQQPRSWAWPSAAEELGMALPLHAKGTAHHHFPSSPHKMNPQMPFNGQLCATASLPSLPCPASPGTVSGRSVIVCWSHSDSLMLYTSFPSHCLVC